MPGLDRAQQRLLIQRAAGGDIPSFEQLVRVHQRIVYRHCLNMLGDPADADEVAQDTFLTAWRALGRFRHDAKFSTWLYRIATNRCLRAIARRSQSGVTHHPPDQPSPHGQPEPELEASERRLRIGLAVAALPPDQRSVLLLREVEGLTYSEITQILGISMSATKSRLNRARKALATTLGDHG